MRAKPTPQLQAQKTVSDPRQPDAVIGFEGRNRVLGREVYILKREMLPTDGPFVGVPAAQAEVIEAGGRDLFVVSDSRVIGVSAPEFREIAAAHTFDDWHGGTVTTAGFHGDDATVWDREHVDLIL